MPANTGVLLVPRSLWGCSGRGGGVPGVQVPLPPQQLVVLGDPLASAVVLSAAKGQVGKKKTNTKEEPLTRGLTSLIPGGTSFMAYFSMSPPPIIS